MQRVAGGSPLHPLESNRSLGLAPSFGLGDAAKRSQVFFVTHLRALIWKLSFGRFFRLDFCAPRPKPSPWGEGGPAQPGRMRGRPGTQRSRRKLTYRRQGAGQWLSTRKGFGGIAPSSVCFADSFPPRGSRSQLQVNRPCPVCTKRLPQPAQPGGGPFPRLDTGPQARIQKRGIPRRTSQTRVGSPEGRNSPLWCSFLHFSHEKWRPPAGIPRGAAPRVG